MKIDNTSFNAGAVKSMTFKEFEKAHGHLKGKDLRSIYEKITGSKVNKGD